MNDSGKPQLYEIIKILAARGREVRESLNLPEVAQPETVGPGGGAIPDSNKNDFDG